MFWERAAVGGKAGEGGRIPRARDRLGNTSQVTPKPKVSVMVTIWGRCIFPAGGHFRGRRWKQWGLSFTCKKSSSSRVCDHRNNLPLFSPSFLCVCHRLPLIKATRPITTIERPIQLKPTAL